MIHLKRIHSFLEHFAEVKNGDTLIFRIYSAAAGIQRGAQEVSHGHTGNCNRVLKCEENSSARAFIGLKFQNILALQNDLTFSNCVVGVPHQCISQGRFSCAVWPHNGVNFALINGQRKTFENFLTFNTYMQVLNFKLRHTLGS